jgi:hypothetical protein
MTLVRIDQLPPGADGLYEALVRDHTARFILYRRLDGFPADIAARPACARMLQETVPTALLRAWRLDGTGWGRIDSGLPADVWGPAAVTCNIPRQPYRARPNGTLPDTLVLPVPDWREAHELSLVRIDEVVRAYTDGATPPPFADLPQRAARDPHYRRYRAAITA